MIHRWTNVIRKLRVRRGDDGFTLVELIVVVVVIGVLAAIAVPVFLGQREKAFEAAAQADLTTIATQVQLMHTQTGTFPTADVLHAAGVDIHTSADVKAAVVWATSDDFCAAATSRGGNLDPSGLAQYAGESGRIFTISAGRGVSAVTASDSGCIFTGSPNLDHGLWTADGYQGP